VRKSSLLRTGFRHLVPFYMPLFCSHRRFFFDITILIYSILFGLSTLTLFPNLGNDHDPSPVMLPSRLTKLAFYLRSSLFSPLFRVPPTFQSLLPPPLPCPFPFFHVRGDQQAFLLSRVFFFLYLDTASSFHCGCPFFCGSPFIVTSADCSISAVP